MYGDNCSQEALHQDSHSFLRRETVLRQAQSNGYRRTKETSRETIEEIMMSSVAERDREYIIRRIGNVQEQKTTTCRLDRFCSLLLARFMVSRL